MKVLVFFALLFVVANAQIGNPHGKEPESPFPEFEDEGLTYEVVDTDDTIETVTTEEDDDDDDDDDDPITTPQPKCQCKKKFWECKKRVRPYDCDGKLKCFEEKSKCYREYKAKNPNMPKKSPEKMACKTTFEGCIAKTDGTCKSKLMCYMAKQRCYMKFKTVGHRGRPRHHRRRPHGHHGRRHRHHRRRPTPCPKMMKCKKEWGQCIMKSKSCSDKLACFWKAYKCMGKSHPRPSPTPTQSSSPALKRRWRPRRWNPKVVAKCKENFKKCINSTSDCRKQIGCFIGMKKCIMQGHRPTPCPKMLKCKMEYKNCTEEATTCDEKLACMFRKHECYESIRPTKPTTQTEDDDDDDDRKYGYGRRPRWNPKLKEKCKKELRKCLNESDSCQKKMKCFWDMKKCMMPRRFGMIHEKMKPYMHKFHSKVTEFVNKVRGLFSRGQLKNRYKNWKQQQRTSWQIRKQRMKQRFGVAQKKLKEKFGLAKKRMQQWRHRPWFG